MIDAMTKNSQTTTSSLKITDNDEPDVIKEKLSLMKDRMRGY